MATVLTPAASRELVRQSLPPQAVPRGQRVYAIAFDMGIDSLRTHDGNPYYGAYLEIRRVLERRGFPWQQGSAYFGTETVTAVTCVSAAQALAQNLAWFAASVRDIRMLRIEELNDLMPAVRQAAVN